MVCSSTMDIGVARECCQGDDDHSNTITVEESSAVTTRNCTCPCSCGVRNAIITGVTPSRIKPQTTNPFSPDYNPDTSAANAGTAVRGLTHSDDTKSNVELVHVHSHTCMSKEKTQEFTTNSSSEATKCPIRLQEDCSSRKQDITFTESGGQIKTKPMAKVRPQVCESVPLRKHADSPTHVKVPLWSDRHQFDKENNPAGFNQLTLYKDSSCEKDSKLRIVVEGVPMQCDLAPPPGHHRRQQVVHLEDFHRGIMGPMAQHSAVLKRTTCPSLEYREREWCLKTLAEEEPMSRTPSPSGACSSTTNPFLAHQQPIITFYPEPQKSPSSTLPPSFTVAIDEYSKVCGYDASKDLQLRRAYHLLEESHCYYGKLSMQEARRKLKHAQPGSYLVRDSSDPAHLLALSVKTARGTTSIRISYSSGLFQLDCEQDMMSRMPVFDCIMKLLHFYTQLTAMHDNNMCVFLESTGRRDTRVALTRPHIHSIGSLKGLARRTLNTMLSEEQRRKLLLFMPPVVESFMLDYPYRV